ncbi:MAG: bifunctional UDP-N-acetylglucosamine diphosphorylase/glucosamine-1-phosphate N-acetyltransferase GlmU [Kineosporiaceae bacterium]
MPDASCAAAVVLAAGQGTRMRSVTPKVLHRLAGRSMLHHALVAASAIGAARVCVVVRHDRDRVAAHVREVAPGTVVADQDEVPGTGRAFACALAALDAAGGTGGGAGGAPPGGRVVVTYGDVPLLRPATLAALLAADPGAAVTVLTAVVDDPAGYGRVVRDPAGEVTGIVEHRDADQATRRLREVNSGVYALDLAFVRDAVARLRPSNAQGELYLTDVVALARADGRRVAAVVADDPRELEGVNDRAQLAAARRRLNDRLLADLMTAGVDVEDPATTWVDAGVAVAPDAVIRPGSHLEGATVVESGAVVGPATTLADARVRAGARVLRSHVLGADVGPGATVGPFAYLRPGTVLGAGAKVGAYVETKNAVLGDGAKVPHLSYVGDITVGRGANIGAGTIVANYDGVAKHATAVGEEARVGSNTVLVAPVAIGAGAYTAAGSVVDADVPAGALAVARGRLHVSEGWVARRRPGTPADEAARSAAADPPEPGPQGQNGADRAPHGSTDRPAASGTTRHRDDSIEGEGA